MNPFLQSALDLASRGFRVFPLVPGTKRPAMKEWQKLATTDPAIITKAWGDVNYNIGVLTGHGLIGIDIDVKNGKDGEASFKALGIPEEYLDTFIVRTPSGGRHVYFKGEGHNSASSLGPGLDVRGDGGFLVGPGSALSNGSGLGSYVIEHDAGIHEMWFGLNHGRKFDDVLHERSTIELDDHTAVTRARDWLAAAPPAVEGQGGDDRTYRTAAKVKDFGVSEHVAFELLLEWNARCTPPWDPDELRDKVAGAYRYGQNPPGSDHPAAVFGDVRVDPPAPAQRSPLRSYRHNDPYDLTKIRWLFQSVWPAHGTAVLVGASQAGKTFLEIECARCLATGKPFFGVEPDEPGGTVFCFAGTEGGGFPLRLKALGEPDSLPITAVEVSNLSERSALDQLLAFLREEDERMQLIFGVPLRMVVLETLSASGLLTKENDNSEAARVMATLGQLANALGVLVVTTHHKPKDGNGARGAGSILDNADTVIEIFRDGREAVRRVEMTKARNAEQRSIGSYTLVPVELGRDYKGRPVTSMVVSMGAPTRMGGRLPPNFERFTQALDFTEQEHAEEIDGYNVIPLKATRSCFGSLVDGERTTVWRHFKQCLAYAKDLGGVEERALQGEAYLIRKEIEDHD